jgi:hypothetical protein
MSADKKDRATSPFQEENDVLGEHLLQHWIQLLQELPCHSGMSPMIACSTTEQSEKHR